MYWPLSKCLLGELKDKGVVPCTLGESPPGEKTSKLLLVCNMALPQKGKKLYHVSFIP